VAASSALPSNQRHGVIVCIRSLLRVRPRFFGILVI
jgi:hypothetical protein